MPKAKSKPPSERLEYVERAVTRDTVLGPMPCVLVTALGRDDPMPVMVTATVLLVDNRGEWLLSHLLVEDESRRQGFAAEVVAFYEQRLGPLPAAWVSPAGEAFARRYVERFGPRPHWQIGRRAVFNEVARRMADAGEERT